MSTSNSNKKNIANFDSDLVSRLPWYSITTNNFELCFYMWLEVQKDLEPTYTLLMIQIEQGRFSEEDVTAIMSVTTKMISLWAKLVTFVGEVTERLPDPHNNFDGHEDFIQSLEALCLEFEQHATVYKTLSELLPSLSITRAYDADLVALCRIYLPHSTSRIHDMPIGELWSLARSLETRWPNMSGFAPGEGRQPYKKRGWLVTSGDSPLVSEPLTEPIPSFPRAAWTPSLEHLIRGHGK
ncbi:hypothetical protein F5Y03DRAFT_398026 [Xylaria venustula]|nr:hypothetical protein F5Y03DRAFT_398026 [Xylaria venustula]